MLLLLLFLVMAQIRLVPFRMQHSDLIDIRSLVDDGGAPFGEIGWIVSRPQVVLIFLIPGNIQQLHNLIQ